MILLGGVAQLLHVLGIDDSTGPWYAFWSGFAGDLPMFGIFLVLWRKHNCHREWCWRVQWKFHEGDHLCRRHHPQG